MPDKPEIVTQRHKEFIRHLSDPNSPTYLNQTESYRKAYPSANGHAQTSASHLMTKPDVQLEFIKNMEKHGLTDDNVNRVHGKILNEGEESNQLKAMKMYHELKGRYDRNRETTQQGNVSININIGRDELDKLQVIDTKEVIDTEGTSNAEC